MDVTTTSFVGVSVTGGVSGLADRVGLDVGVVVVVNQNRRRISVMGLDRDEGVSNVGSKDSSVFLGVAAINESIGLELSLAWQPDDSSCSFGHGPFQEAVCAFFV